MPHNVVSASWLSLLLSTTYLTAVATVSAAVPDAVSNATIPLPAGHYSTLKLLGAAAHGAQTNQNFVVTYTNGTTSTITQSLSDWWGPPQNFAGESQVSKMPYLVAPTGATVKITTYLYSYTFAIDGTRTVKSLTLPNNRNVAVLAVDVGAQGAPSVGVNLAGVDNVVVFAGNGTAPGTTWVSSGYAYSADLLGTSISFAGSTFTLGSPGSTTAPITQTLQISGAPTTTAEVGQFYSFRPTVVAPAGSSLAYEVSNKPAWAQFSAATGTLSGTPSTGSAATDANIVVSVSSGAQSASLPAFSITVEPAAATTAGAASLSWSVPTTNTNGSPLTNLAGFVIRYGTSSTALEKQISIASPSATGAEVSNLSPGNWYFQVAAVNTANVEGQFSAVVGRTID
jgi:hypothetical protein